MTNTRGSALKVLLYHVVYFYNNKGVFGGFGGVGHYPEVPQYQDVLMYMLYPWFMPLLYEVLRRIPVLRWYVLGIRKRDTGTGRKQPCPDPETGAGTPAAIPDKR